MISFHMGLLKISIYERFVISEKKIFLHGASLSKALNFLRQNFEALVFSIDSWDIKYSLNVALEKVFRRYSILFSFSVSQISFS